MNEILCFPRLGLALYFLFLWGVAGLYGYAIAITQENKALLKASWWKIIIHIARAALLGPLGPFYFKGSPSDSRN